MQVHAEATKIAKETEDANIIAAQVAAELEKALPALQEAEAALNVLTKKDISELKVCCGAVVVPASCPLFAPTRPPVCYWCLGVRPPLTQQPMPVPQLLTTLQPPPASAHEYASVQHHGVCVCFV